MEVILLENIKNLGQIGDVVSVKRGHGRNFLIKYGKALKASKDNIDLVNKNLELIITRLKYNNIYSNLRHRAILKR